MDENSSTRSATTQPQSAPTQRTERMAELLASPFPLGRL